MIKFKKKIKFDLFCVEFDYSSSLVFRFDYLDGGIVRDGWSKFHYNCSTATKKNRFDLKHSMSLCWILFAIIFWSYSIGINLNGSLLLKKVVNSILLLVKVNNLINKMKLFVLLLCLGTALAGMWIFLINLSVNYKNSMHNKTIIKIHIEKKWLTQILTKKLSNLSNCVTKFYSKWIKCYN